MGYLRAGRSRQSQQVVNEQPHLFRSCTDALEVGLSLFVNFVSIIFQNGLAETVDDTQRGTEIMRYGVTEGLKLAIAGDRTYAPPEQLYSNLHADFVVRRIGCDLYLLGNLAAFLFSGVNVTSALFSRLDPAFHPNNWAGTYDQVLPHLQRAFSDVLADLSANIDPLVGNEITTMVRELCNPDLARRGHRKGIGSFSQYSLERYKSHTDLLLKRTTVSARMRQSA